MIADHPGRFTSMTTCWNAINADDLRQAAGRKPGSAARMFQLAETGEMMYVDDVPYFEEAGMNAGSMVCALSRNMPPGCWRCGEETHLRRDCPHPASAAEINNEPLNKWAKYSRPGKMMGGGAWPTTLRGQGIPAASTTNVAPLGALTARMDRQDAMFEAVLERFSSMIPQTSRSAETSQAAGGGSVIEIAPAPVLQMAAQGPVPGSAPFIITNEGAQSEGYVYIGANHGVSIWGRVDAVAASLPEVHGESGNGGDM